MTGRAAGYCAGNGMPGYANPAGGRGLGRGRGGFGRGLGFGRGFGRGRAWGAPAWGAATYAAPPAYAPTPEQELAGLRQQAESLQGALEDIQQRIGEIENQD